MAIGTTVFDQSRLKCIVMGHVQDKDGQMSKQCWQCSDPMEV